MLVTGASSGIGAAVTRIAGREGFQLVLSGRDEDRLKKVLSGLSGGGHRAIQGDLRTPEARRELVAECGDLAAVVHCAGVHAFTFPGRTERKYEDLMETNVRVPIALTDEL